MGQKNHLLYIASYGLYEGKIQKLHHSFYDQYSVRRENGTIKKDSRVGSLRIFKKGRITEKIELCLLISLREGEILLVDLTPLVDISMQVYLRGLDRGMTEVFLYNPEIL